MHARKKNEHVSNIVSGNIFSNCLCHPVLNFHVLSPPNRCRPRTAITDIHRIRPALGFQDLTGRLIETAKGAWNRIWNRTKDMWMNAIYAFYPAGRSSTNIQSTSHPNRSTE